MALSLVAGLAATVYQARRAERRFQQVRAMAGAFLFDFHDEIRELPGSTEARRRIVQTALEYLDSLAREARQDASLEWELAVAYERIGEVQGHPYRPNLGHMREALASYQKALEISQRLVARHPNEGRFLRLLARCHYEHLVTAAIWP